MIIYWIVCVISILITLVVTRVSIKITMFRVAEKQDQQLGDKIFRILSASKSNLMELITGLAYEKKRKNKGWFAALICGLPLLLLSSFRYMVGSDYVAYEEIYYKIKGNQTMHDYEWLFTLLNVHIGKLGFDFQALVVLTSVVYCLLVFKVILEDSSCPEMSIFLLLAMTFYFQSLNVMRNMLACAICLYSMRYIKKRNIIMFGVCIILALGFHLSAVAFIPLYFIPQKRLKPSVYIVAFCGIAVSVGIIGTVLSQKIVQLGANLNNGYYLKYFLNNEYAGFGIVSFMINLCLFLWAYVFVDKKDRTSTLLLNIQFLALLLSMMNGSFPLVNRIRFYYGLPGILLIPRVLSSYNMKKNGDGFVAINYVAIAAMFFGYCYYIEGILNESGCIPYQSVL